MTLERRTITNILDQIQWLDDTDLETLEGAIEYEKFTRETQ